MLEQITGSDFDTKGLKEFQKAKGLTVDGKCGLATKKKLKEE